MAVKSSGALSLTTDIVGEFGGVAPHSLSEYYGGGTYVPAGANPGIATSGQINMGSHYGAVAATVLTISSNTNNYDIGAAAIAAGGDKSTPVILTINAGVTVGSTSSATAAMFTGTGWSSGTTINITNNGSIVGASGVNTSGGGSGGGAGGAGSGYRYTNGSGGGSGSSGSGSADTENNGGNAFEHSQTADNNLSVIFDTAGTRTAGASGTKTILGGGGGGGGGGPGYHASNYSNIGGGGGGGGGGYGSGGAKGVGTGSNGNNGYNGGATNGGGGGARGSYGGFYGGYGGAGGSLGNSGSSGNKGTGANANGGGGGSGGSSNSASGSSGSALAGNTSQIS